MGLLKLLKVSAKRGGKNIKTKGGNITAAR
jgi:hypothetical protein